MAQPLYVSETRTLHQVLTQLQQEHINMAIVLDEYGGVSGLVTREDLVEEFVGELYDENEDEKRQLVARINERELRIAGNAALHVVNDHLDTQLPNAGEAQTLGGYITEQIGRIPAVHEELRIPQGTFTITEVSGNRVVTVRFRREAAPDPE